MWCRVYFLFGFSQCKKAQAIVQHQGAAKRRKQAHRSKSASTEASLGTHETACTDHEILYIVNTHQGSRGTVKCLLSQSQGCSLQSSRSRGMSEWRFPTNSLPRHIFKMPQTSSKACCLGDLEAGNVFFQQHMMLWQLLPHTACSRLSSA